MKELVMIAIGSALVNNVVLGQFLGLSAFLGVSKNTGIAAGMGSAVVFVLTLASLITSFVSQYVLTPFHLEHLKMLALTLVIVSLVLLIEIILKNLSVRIYDVLAAYLPLVTINCVILGTALIYVQAFDSTLKSTVNALATAVGFAVVMVLMAGAREKMEYNDIPASFRGVPIVLLTACLMAISFWGFIGL